MLLRHGCLTYCIYKHSAMDISVEIMSGLFYLLDETDSIMHVLTAMMHMCRECMTSQYCSDGCRCM
jgi:hypothetical protein